MRVTTEAPAQPSYKVLRRASDGRLLAGVAAGLGEHLGLSPLVIRAAFVLLAVTGGMGFALYGAFWVFVPQQQEGSGVASARSRGQLLAFAALGLGALLMLERIGWLHGRTGALPLAAVAVGVALVWRQADEAQRSRWRASASGPGGLARAGAGAALLAFGLAGFLASRGELGAAREGLVSTAVVVVGLVVLTAPFWRGMTNDLRNERRERIRSQERAEVAAHVHDSVLQTLALIQKAADDPREVTRLARGQERELRGWLYRPAGDPQLTFAAALEHAAAEVEESHRTPVEVVVVGDCPASPASWPPEVSSARPARGWCRRLSSSPASSS